MVNILFVTGIHPLCFPTGYKLRYILPEVIYSLFEFWIHNLFYQSIPNSFSKFDKYISLRIANVLKMDTLVRTIHLGLKFRGKVSLKHLVTLWCLLSCFLRYNIRFAYQAQQFKGNLKATHFIGWSIRSQSAIIYDGFYVIYKLTPAIPFSMFLWSGISKKMLILFG